MKIKEKILAIYKEFNDGKYSKIFKTTDFAYRQIVIERPLRLNFQVSKERIEKITDNPETIKILEGFPDKKLFINREKFLETFNQYIKSLKLSASQKKSILAALSERDEKADICLDAGGNPEPDSELRDYENVPYGTDIYEYFEKEVKPYAADAWINETVRDHKDNEVGKVGYEIPFTRYFYKYEAPRSLEEIETDIESVENELLDLLKKL